MSTRKHVNLDMDVHLKLTKQHKRSKLTIKSIANSILRCALSGEKLLREIIGEVLIEKGCIAEEGYVDVVDHAFERIRARATADQTVFEKCSDGEFTAGSWKIKVLHCCPHGSHQVVEASGRDARRRSTSFHVHSVTETAVVVSGHVIVHLEDRIRLLDPLDSICILPGTAHSMTPLTANTVLSITLVPSCEAFA